MSLIESPTDSAGKAAAKQALLSGLTEFLDSHDKVGPGLATAKTGLPVSVLALQDVLDGFRLDKAQPVGWGFLAGGPDSTAVAAQITRSEDDGSLVLTSLAHGPEIALLIKAIQDVALLPQVQADNYSVGIIRVPAILVEALWLKSASTAPDLVVTFHTLSANLIANHPYTADEFMDAILPLAETFKAFDQV